MTKDQSTHGRADGEHGSAHKLSSCWGTGRLVAAVLFLLVGLSVAPTSAVAADAYVHIDEVSVSDDNPEPGETVTFDVTLEVGAGSDAGYDVSYVSIRTRSGEELDYIRDIGSIGAGDSMNIQLTTQFEETGIKEVVVVAGGENIGAAGGKVVRNVVTVDVEEPPAPAELKTPDITIDTGSGTDSPVAHTNTDVSVKVSNPNDEAISDLELVLTGEDGVLETSRTVEPEIGAMNASTFEFTTVINEPGQTDLTAQLSYDGGSASETSTVNVVPMNAEISMFTEVENGKLHTTVVNLGNTELRNFAIEGYGKAQPIGLGTLAPGQSKTTTLEMGAVKNFMISARYQAGSENKIMHRNVTAPPENTESSTTESNQNSATVGGADTSSGSSDGADGQISLLLGGLLVAAVGTIGLSYFASRRD